MRRTLSASPNEKTLRQTGTGQNACVALLTKENEVVVPDSSHARNHDFSVSLTLKVPLQSLGLGLKAMGLASLGRKCNQHYADFDWRMHEDYAVGRSTGLSPFRLRTRRRRSSCPQCGRRSRYGPPRRRSDSWCRYWRRIRRCRCRPHRDPESPCGPHQGPACCR